MTEEKIIIKQLPPKKQKAVKKAVTKISKDYGEVIKKLAET